jgi:phosphohistidine phosphatase SixA
MGAVDRQAARIVLLDHRRDEVIAMAWDRGHAVAGVRQRATEQDGAESPETVMIGGHNPGLEELVEQLTGERQDLPTAALAQIDLPIDQWRDLTLSTRGRLVGLWRPKQLT